MRAALARPSRYEYPQQRITINLAPADLPKGRRTLRPRHRARHPRRRRGRFAAGAARTASTTASCRCTASCAGSAVRCRPRSRAAVPAPRASSCRVANASEAALVERAATVLAASSLLRGVRAYLRTRRRCSASQRATPATARASRRARSQRRARSGAREARPRDRGGGRTQRAAHRAARHRQEHARAPTARPAAAARRDRRRSRAPAIRSAWRQLPFDAASWRTRPFPRAPSHGVGGRARRRRQRARGRAKISLAHHGVLFLDELPEFDRARARSAARDRSSTGACTSRARRVSAEFPAAAAAHRRDESVSVRLSRRGDAVDARRSASRAIARRVSGPLLDRIDLHVEVPRPPPDALAASPPQGDTSESSLQRVGSARERVSSHAPDRVNARLSAARAAPLLRARARGRRSCSSARATQLGLSARACHRCPQARARHRGPRRR